MSIEVAEQIAASVDRRPSVNGIRIVGVDGRSGSGKTFLATQLSALMAAPIVEIDDFVSWDCFAGWWPRFDEQVLSPLLAGQDAIFQARDWTDWDGSTLGEWKTQRWSPTVIIEGVTCTRRDTIGRITYAIWVEAPTQIRLARGLARDTDFPGKEERVICRYDRALFVVTEVCSQRGCCHTSLSGCGLLPGGRIARAADAATAMMGGRLSWRFARYERVAADHASWAERCDLHAARRAFGRDSHTRYVGVGARLLQLVGYLFCIAAVFVGIAAGILTLISSRLSARGRIAGRSPLSTCAQVSAAAAGPGPYRLSGHTGNPAQGDFPAPLSGMLCVWYRLRVHRRYRTTVMRPDNEGDWREFEVLAEEPVWEWDCGPFPVQDATGAALVAPALLEHSTALSPRPGGQRGASADLAAGFGRAMAAEPTASTAYQWVKDLAKDRYPARTTVNELYQEGAEESRYRSGAIGTLRAHALLPDSLLRHFADPATKTLGYRVTEETIPPGLPLNVFALATVVGGRTILTNPFADVPALSVEQLPSVLASGARRSARWIVLLAITALLLLAAALILLVPTVRSGTVARGDAGGPETSTNSNLDSSTPQFRSARTHRLIVQPHSQPRIDRWVRSAAMSQNA